MRRSTVTAWDVQRIHCFRLGPEKPVSWRKHLGAQLSAAETWSAPSGFQNDWRRGQTIEQLTSYCEISLKRLLTSGGFEWQPRKAETKKLSLYNIFSIFLLSTLFPQIMLMLFTISFRLDLDSNMYWSGEIALLGNRWIRESTFRVKVASGFWGYL